jgi:hypothetical protein
MNRLSRRHKPGQVNVLTRRPKDWADRITITTEGSSWETKGTFIGKLNKVRGACPASDPRMSRVPPAQRGHGRTLDHDLWAYTRIQVSDDPSEVVPGSDYVIVAAPANAHPDLLKVGGWEWGRGYRLLALTC